MPSRSPTRRTRPAGRCTRCWAKPPVLGKTKCLRCLARMAARIRERRDEWRRDATVCVGCGKPRRLGAAACAACRESWNRARRNRSANARVTGRCVRCFRERGDLRLAMCGVCAAWFQRRDLIRSLAHG